MNEGIGVRLLTDHKTSQNEYLNIHVMDRGEVTNGVPTNYVISNGIDAQDVYLRFKQTTSEQQDQGLDDLVLLEILIDRMDKTNEYESKQDPPDTKYSNILMYLTKAKNLLK